MDPKKPNPDIAFRSGNHVYDSDGVEVEKTVPKSETHPNQIPLDFDDDSGSSGNSPAPSSGKKDSDE